MKLTNKDLETLKKKGFLNGDEIAIREGNIIIAENVLTKVRRILDVGGLLLESNVRVLED